MKYETVEGLALNMVIYNEEIRLQEIFELDLLNLFDEVIIVDQESNDKSLKIIEEMQKLYNIKYLKDKHTGFCESSRQLANSNTTMPWVLCMDADERPTEEFIIALPTLISNKEVEGYKCPFEHMVGGVPEQAAHFEYQKVRLYRQDKVEHLSIVHSSPQVKIVKQIDFICFHHFKNWTEWKYDHLRYTALKAGKYSRE